MTQPSFINKKFGSALRNYRKAAKISQRKIARLASMSQPHIANIESGKQNITLELLNRYLNALDATADITISSRTTWLEATADERL